MGTPIVASFGMGCDSTDVFLRWCEEPTCRDFEWDRLIMLSAQTGEEFVDTKTLIETHVLPRMRYHRVRFVQVARAGPLESDGIVVLSDTRNPTKLHIKGAYRLSEELLSAGTVPQYASGCRRCSLKAKGTVLDHWIEQELGDRPFRHVMGFNADELNRVERDKSYSARQRQSEYPLVQWGWGREKVENYARQILGVPLVKSCCVMCPFAGGKAPMMERYKKFPDTGAFTIFIEHVSLALNPRMTLYSGGLSARESIANSRNEEALYLAGQRLDRCEWALYHVQRIYWSKHKAGQDWKVSSAWRKVAAIELGSRRDMSDLLTVYGEQLDRDIEWAMGSPRLYLRKRGQNYMPVQSTDTSERRVTLEEFYVPAPATVQDKCRPSFDKRWREMTEYRQMRLVEAFNEQQLNQLYQPEENYAREPTGCPV